MFSSGIIKRRALFLNILIMGLFFSGSSFDASGQNATREAVVAGAFYPSNPQSLNETLESLFMRKEGRVDEGIVRALVVPHAGYTYSGEIAAAGYQQIDSKASYDNIFILASSHHVGLGKASVYNKGPYRTPLGEVPVNIEIASKLIEENDCFTFDHTAHSREHSIEVQLPFIQYHFNKTIPIVPIVLATQNQQKCREIAEALKPWFNTKNLFIVSADFSHYPDYESAKKVDKVTADAFCTGEPEKFLAALKSNAEKRIPGLVTSMCAWPAGLSLLYLSENDRNIRFNQVLYRNSGDSKVKSMRSEVVGYHAITLVEENEDSFNLNEEDKIELLKISRQTLDSYISLRNRPQPDPADFSESLLSQTGCFVSLKKEGKLRGCIGTFKPDSPLYKLVQSLTIASATEDTRFLPVQKRELNDISIEISVLTPLRKIKDIDEIVPGKHGIYISKNGRSGTFLPQVARENGWTLEELLGYCSEKKAGIGWDGWKDAEIFTYEAIVFKESDFYLNNEEKGVY